MLTTITKKGHFSHLRRYLRACMIAAFAFVIAGCAQTPLQPEADVVESTEAQPVAEAEEEPRFPDVELTSELIYDLMLAEVARQNEHPDIATEALSRAAFATRDPRVVARATASALHAGDFPQALDMARLWVTIEPESNAANDSLAQILVALDRSDEARELFVQMIRKAEPDVASAYRRIAEMMARQKQTEGLLPVMDELIGLHPDVAEAHFAKALLANRMRKLDIVDQSLDEALRLRPDWEDAALAKVSNLASENKNDKVRNFSEQFLRDNSAANAFRMNYARWLLDQDEVSPALVQFAEVVEREPDNADALYAAGLLSIEEEDYRAATRFLERHLEQRPQHDQTRLYLGQVASEREQYEKAESWLKKVSSDEHYFDAQVRIGGVVAASGDVDGALDHLQNISWINEEQQVRLILAREEVLREAKRLPDAKNVLDDALQQLPENTDLLYARGLVAAQLKLVDVHERDLRKLIEQDPENAHAYNALGYTLADLTDRHQEAFDLITKALELRPDDPFIMDSMGWVQYRLGNHELAIDYLERAFALREDAEIAAHLGELFWVSGERRRAETVWKKGLKSAPDNEVLLGTIRKLKQ